MPGAGSIRLGVMIEVPSAALLARQLAAEVDFASVGTNDLCQYLFAADRTNRDVAPMRRSTPRCCWSCWGA